ncbi:MAG: DNA primase [Bacteroidota bacterium]
MIPREKVAEIQETARIEEVVGEFVSLKKRGSNLTGLCPFHQEKTPSFSVSPAKGIYKCFGCGAAGNAVNFVMEHEHYTYPEALRYLAGKYNIEIEEKEETEEERQAKDERESLLAVTAFAQKHFSRNLWESAEGKSVGLSYLKERGFLEKTIKEFQLGYSPQSWDDFTKTAQKNGYKNKFLEKSGLSIIKPHQAYDRFRNRVIFPIHNLSGKVVGFGARLLTNDKKQPKYLNSPESEIYNKSKILYGIYFAKSEMVKEDQCLLTEGYTDVISLYQSGIKNAVASSGTSLTEDQIRLIKRYTQNITILYDGDAAGLKASFRGIDMILQQGMNVKVVLFPEGEDPDSYASAHSATETRKYIQEKAEDFIRFKSRVLFKENQDDPAARANAMEEIAYSISLIPNLLIRDQYIKATWESLGIEQEKLNYRIAKLRTDRRKKDARNQQESLPEKTPKVPSESNRIFEETYPSEDEVIRVIILYGRYLMEYDNENEPLSISVAEFIVNELKHIDFAFRDKNNQQIFDAFCNELEQDNIPETSFFLNLPDPKLSQHVIHLISEKFSLSENWEKQMGIFTAHESDNIKFTVESLIWDNKARQIEQRLNELNKEIKNAPEEKIMELLKVHHELKTQHALINQKRGRIITK